jgi:hypothetical protein
VPLQFLDELEELLLRPGESKVMLDCDAKGEPEATTFKWEKVKECQVGQYCTGRKLS